MHYIFSDHLGSTSLITDAVGTMSSCNGYTSGQFESDYYPYGGEQPICANLGDQNYKFTEKERDSESGLDYFGARNYASNFGAFVSPDRYNVVLTRHGLEGGGLPSEAAAAFLDGYIENPQNWNEYAYVRNNPLNFVDPTGDAADGHHLFSERDNLTSPLARDITDKIKTGPLSGDGTPNQPGFNKEHIEYNRAVEEALEDMEKTEGDRNNWSVAQWKEAAWQILNSTKPAIKNFLDDLDANNPGARKSLAAAISAYRITAFTFARIVAAAVAAAIDGAAADIVIFIPQPHRPRQYVENINPNRRHCLIDRKTNECVGS